MTQRAEHAADLLAQVLRPAGARFGVEVIASLGPLVAYAEALLRWNRSVNLTGARNLEVLASEHLADALALAPHLPRTGRWVDVGSGGGLPGMVLAILRRDLQAVLLEPLHKRRRFLSSVVRDLDLQNVRIVGDRLDKHLERGGRGVYELAVSRAVFPLGEWLEHGRALVRSDGGIVLGLEGSARRELPGDAERLPYNIGFGERAIIRVRV